MINTEVYEHFEAWLDNLLENNDMPENTKAFNFNLYDDSSADSEERVFGIQPIAAEKFDPDDEEGEWACYEIWSSEEDIFYIDLSDEEDQSGEHAQEIYIEIIREYLESGKYAGILKAKPIGIGFVDGDLEIIKGK